KKMLEQVAQMWAQGWQTLEDGFEVGPELPDDWGGPSRQADVKPAAELSLPEIKRPKGPQADRAFRVLPELYPPHGVVPLGISIETVRGKVGGALASENEQLDLRSPEWDVVDRCVKYLRALHA